MRRRSSNFRSTSFLKFVHTWVALYSNVQMLHIGSSHDQHLFSPYAIQFGLLIEHWQWPQPKTSASLSFPPLARLSFIT
jgi:hypothetical protein